MHGLEISVTQTEKITCDIPRLLLVDDDHALCRVLGRALAKLHFEVLTACDIATGLYHAAHAQPDYAVIDLRIGSESGLTLVEKLLELNPAMRIVVLTGYASIATAVEAIKLGAVHYLSKPAEPEDILKALNHDKGDTLIDIQQAPVSVRRMEWEHLNNILQTHGGNISAAARTLNMHRRTLQRKLQKRPVQE